MHHTLSLLSLSTHPPPPPTYPLSLHDALPISVRPPRKGPMLRQRSASYTAGLTCAPSAPAMSSSAGARRCSLDRKSTRLNSSHITISYAVFCLKKKKKNKVLAERTQAITGHVG